jgi:hypothetical protein
MPFNDAVPNAEHIQHLRWDNHERLVGRVSSQGGSDYGLLHGTISARAWKD